MGDHRPAPVRRPDLPMSESRPVNGDTVELLRDWTAGSHQAGSVVFNHLYAELHRVAANLRRGEPEHDLQTTALVHELYLRLAGLERIRWQDRNQFFAVCARVMRNILIDQARARQAHKRGGQATEIHLEAAAEWPGQGSDEDLIAIDRCLEELQAIDPDRAKLIELRYFAGLSLEQTAMALGTSRASVVRSWRLTKGWLQRRLDDARKTPS